MINQRSGAEAGELCRELLSGFHSFSKEPNFEAKLKSTIEAKYLCGLSISKVELLKENLVAIYQTLSAYKLLPAGKQNNFLVLR